MNRRPLDKDRVAAAGCVVVVLAWLAFLAAVAAPWDRFWRSLINKGSWLEIPVELLTFVVTFGSLHGMMVVVDAFINWLHHEPLIADDGISLGEGRLSRRATVAYLALVLGLPLGIGIATALDLVSK